MCVCLRICLWCNSLFRPPQSFSNLCPVELCIVFQWSACWDSSFFLKKNSTYECAILYWNIYLFPHAI